MNTVEVDCDQDLKIPVGISSCLLGERVRFDSGHKNNSYITGTLADYFSLRPFCPEVSIGLVIHALGRTLLDEFFFIIVGARCWPVILVAVHSLIFTLVIS